VSYRRVGSTSLASALLINHLIFAPCRKVPYAAKEGHDRDTIRRSAVQQPELEHQEFTNVRVGELRDNAPPLREGLETGGGRQRGDQHASSVCGGVLTDVRDHLVERGPAPTRTTLPGGSDQPPAPHLRLDPCVRDRPPGLLVSHTTCHGLSDVQVALDIVESAVIWQPI
jgi:hypothetical protein